MESVETRLAKSAGSRYSRAHRQTFYWTVNPRVVVGSLVDQLNVEGNAVSLAVTASESGATLTFSATGLFIDPASGVISGTISESALTTVPYAVTATVATFTNSDPNWVWWQFSATINWGDGTSNAGTVNGGNGAFTVSGSHVYARAGNYATSVAIGDGFQTVTSAGSVAVSAAPIVVSGGFVQGAAAGIEVSATLASFTGNASALASTFTATINWGDTTTSLGTVSGVNGKFVVAGRHTYASTGTYTIGVSVTDLDASTGSGTSTVQVGDVLAGIPATLTVATFRSNDPNATASQFSATIVWGDGSSNTSGIITALAGGVYNVQGTHKYAADGAYTVTTTVYGPYSESITASRSVTAKAPALTGYAENIAAKPGVAFSNVAVAEFIDPNQADTSGMFTATINWGDGTSSSGTVSGSNGVFEVKGGHTYATAGSYMVQVAVQQLRNSVTALALSTVSTALVSQKTDQAPSVSIVPLTLGEMAAAFKLKGVDPKFVAGATSQLKRFDIDLNKIPADKANKKVVYKTTEKANVGFITGGAASWVQFRASNVPANNWVIQTVTITSKYYDAGGKELKSDNPPAHVYEGWSLKDGKTLPDTHLRGWGAVPKDVKGGFTVGKPPEGTVSVENTLVFTVGLGNRQLNGDVFRQPDGYQEYTAEQGKQLVFLKNTKKTYQVTFKFSPKEIFFEDAAGSPPVKIKLPEQ